MFYSFQGTSSLASLFKFIPKYFICFDAKWNRFLNFVSSLFTSMKHTDFFKFYLFLAVFKLLHRLFSSVERGLLSSHGVGASAVASLVAELRLAGCVGFSSFRHVAR